MRNAFAAEITACAVEMPQLLLLSGHADDELLDEYGSRCAERFIQCGVAEANMIGVAAGLAHCGLRPVAHAVSSFLATRCVEQIRIDLCHQRLPVVLVGIGGGLSYAGLGPTHQACEDIAILRALPNMTVICPGDAIETRLALRAALGHDGPVYLRLGDKGEPIVHRTSPRFTIGRGIVVRRGDDLCLLCTGNMLPVAVGAAEALANRGVSVEVVSLHTVKPLDEALLAQVFWRFPAVVTLEEHGRAGGLGSAVAEWLTDQPRQRGRLHRLGTSDVLVHVAGDRDHARARFGLTAPQVAASLLRLCVADARHRDELEWDARDA